MRVGVGRVMAWVQGDGTQRRGLRAQCVLMFFCVASTPPAPAHSDSIGGTVGQHGAVSGSGHYGK